jgi:hypothetical protein
MPVRIDQLITQRDFYHNVFIGDQDAPSHVKLDPAALTVDTVDQWGYFKPGVPLTIDGRLPGADDAVYGVTIEEMKVALNNNADSLAAAAAIGMFAVVGTDGLVNRDLMESNLGRPLSANELAAFAAVGCKLQLTKHVA